MACEVLTHPVAAPEARPRASELDMAVAVRQLGKCYRIYDRPQDRLKQALCRGRRRYFREFWALRDVSFEIRRGETIGILGRNGSGKSTLLQLVCGTLTPTAGQVEIHGRIAALLELGAGFNPEFTGRDNVYTNAAILGLTKNEIDARYPAIVEFAEIGQFIDQPVKTYSSGMYVRLAFAVAINVDPDILIVDEALSVGDARFQARCMTRIRQMQERGVSILFVTHDLEACKRLCQRAYVLERGQVVHEGSAEAMANWYWALAIRPEGAPLPPKTPAAEPAPVAPAALPAEGGNHAPSAHGCGKASCDSTARVSRADAESASPAGWSFSLPASENNDRDRDAFLKFRHGDGQGEILDVWILDSAGNVAENVFFNERYVIRCSLVFHASVESAILGFILCDRLGTEIIAVNTFQEKACFPPVKDGDRVTVEYELALNLRPGFYSLTLGLAYSQIENRFMDFIHNAIVFRVVDPDPRHTVFGLVHPAVSVRVEKPGACGVSTSVNQGARACDKEGVL
jgi:lipopolysaccharide transport system ATP-binding protein